MSLKLSCGCIPWKHIICGYGLMPTKCNPCSHSHTGIFDLIAAVHLDKGAVSGRCNFRHFVVSDGTIIR